MYDDGGTLWETRAWQDPATGQSFDTHEMLGTTYPEIADLVYQEDDGSYWLKRTWQDPATGATWDTYENIGVPVDDQTASSLPQVSAVPRFAQAGLPPADIGGADGRSRRTAAEDRRTADARRDAGRRGRHLRQRDGIFAFTRQAIQSFDQATNDLRDVAAARTAAQLGGQVADEFANALVQRAPGRGWRRTRRRAAGRPGGGRSTTASSGLLGASRHPRLRRWPRRPAVAVATSAPPPPPPPSNQVSSPPPPPIRRRPPLLLSEPGLAAGHGRSRRRAPSHWPTAACGSSFRQARLANPPLF